MEPAPQQASEAGAPPAELPIAGLVDVGVERSPAQVVAATVPGAESTREARDGYVVYRPQLTVADGFRFGCGFIAAGVVFYLVLMIALTLIYLTALVLRLPVPGFPG